MGKQIGVWGGVQILRQKICFSRERKLGKELERVVHFKILEIRFDKTTLDYGAIVYCSAVDTLIKKFDKILINKISVLDYVRGPFNLSHQMGEQPLEEE